MFDWGIIALATEGAVDVGGAGSATILTMITSVETEGAGGATILTIITPIATEGRK